MKGTFIISAEEAAKFSLNDLGRSLSSNGCLRHHVLTWVIECIPGWGKRMIKKILYRKTRDFYRKEE